MPIWMAVLLGAVQGLSEFLPISSSGHLALLQIFLDFESYGLDSVTFNIVVHLGTLTAVFIAFWDDIKKLIVEFVAMCKDRFAVRQNPTRKMVVMLIIATVPLALGAVIEGAIEAAFGSALFIGCALLVTATLLIFADKLGGGNKTEATASYKNAAFVGIMQLLAVFPGISRSGSTMCAGLFSGFDRDFAVRFAFIMSIPAVLGSAVFKLPDMLAEGISRADASAYIIGFLAAAISGYAAIKLVRTLVKRKAFKYFSIYCAVVGIAAILYSLM